MLNGAEYVVEAVATSPTLDVCVANAACRVSGSNLSIWPGCWSGTKARLSPTNRKSSFPRSHESAIVLKIAKSSLVVAAPGNRQPDTWFPVPTAYTPRFICLPGFIGARQSVTDVPRRAQQLLSHSRQRRLHL